MLSVLKGHLSIVGAPLRETSQKQPNYFYKPGLFGLLQLNKNRIQDSGDEEKYELFYLKNQNLWLDLEILLRSLAQRNE